MIDTIAAIEEAPPAALKAAARADEARPLLAIRFSRGTTGLLDASKLPGSVWARVLRNLQELARPVYVEIDPRTQLVTQVRQPTLQPVGAIEPAEEGGDMRVELMRSHAVHTLRRTHPRYAEMLKLLRAAQAKKSSVWVTDDLDTHDIMDVHPASEPSDR